MFICEPALLTVCRKQLRLSERSYDSCYLLNPHCRIHTCAFNLDLKLTDKKCWEVRGSLTHKWSPYFGKVKQSELRWQLFCLFSVQDELKLFRTDYLNCLCWPSWLTAVYSAQTATKWDPPSPQFLSVAWKVCVLAHFCLVCSNYGSSCSNSSPSVRWQFRESMRVDENKTLEIVLFCMAAL